MPRNVWNDIVSWRTKRLNNSTKYQLHALTTIISKKNNWNPWENCQKYALRLSWNDYTWHVLEDPIFKGQWKNLTIDQKWTKACDKRLNRLISYIHHTCEYKQYCYVGNIRFYLQYCHVGNSRGSWGFKIYIRWNIVHFRKWFVCANQLDVKETNFSFAQFNRIKSHFFGCRLKVGRYTRTWFMGSDCRSSSTETRIRIIKNGETCVRTNVRFVQYLTHFKNERNLMEWSMIWTMLILFPQTWILLIRKLCWMSLNTTKQWLRWS